VYDHKLLKSFAGHQECKGQTAMYGAENAIERSTTETLIHYLSSANPSNELTAMSSE
jgi:hypothetical protein